MWIMQGKFTEEAGCEPVTSGGDKRRRKSHLTKKPMGATGLE